jgi:HK97 family phage major capsid protein
MDEKQYKELRETFEQFKTTDAEMHVEIKKYGEASAETVAKLEKLNERIDQLETKANRPAIEAPGAKADASPDATKAFREWSRHGEKGMSPESVKLLSTNSDPDGGYLMPENMASQVALKLIEFSPVRELANVITISAGNSIKIPVEDSTDFAASWVGETAARTETTSGKLAMVEIVAHEMYANPFATQALLDDSAFNVESWLADRVTMRFAVTEGTAFLTGSGASRPEGILTNATVIANQVKTGHATLLTADGLMDLYHALPEMYARAATFLMKRATLGAVRKLKDGAGNYLWMPGLSANAPATILGQPYREAIDMPAVGAAALPILFGDFNRGYQIVDRQGVRVQRDPYTSKPKVEFYTTKRVGGAVVLAEAIRAQVVSA